MTTSEIVSAFLGVITAIVALVAYRQSTQAQRATAKAAEIGIDAAAYERAKELYESAIASSVSETDRLQRTVSELRREVTALQTSNSSLVREISKLRTSNVLLRAEIQELRRA